MGVSSLGTSTTHMSIPNTSTTIFNIPSSTATFLTLSTISISHRHNTTNQWAAPCPPATCPHLPPQFLITTTIFLLQLLVATTTTTAAAATVAATVTTWFVFVVKDVAVKNKSLWSNFLFFQNSQPQTSVRDPALVGHQSTIAGQFEQPSPMEHSSSYPHNPLCSVGGAGWNNGSSSSTNGNTQNVADINRTGYPDCNSVAGKTYS